MKHCSRGLAGWWAPRVGMGSAGCRDHGLDDLVEGSDARFSRLVSTIGYLAGPAVAGEGLADPPVTPRVQVVVAGLQGLDHSRDPGRGRAVGDGVEHVAADLWIGIPASSSNLVHTRSSSAGRGRCTGSCTRAGEPGSPRSGTAPAVRRWHPRLCVPRRPAGRPAFSAILLHRPTVQTIAPAGCPDHGVSRQLAEASTLDFTGSPEVARQTGTAAGGPLKRLTPELGGKPESAGRRIRMCVRSGQPAAKDPQRHADCPPMKGSAIWSRNASGLHQHPPAQRRGSRRSGVENHRR